MDTFWSREFVDEWNDEHSPQKKLFPDASKSSPKKAASTKAAAAAEREAKKAFEKNKHQMAEAFIRELDEVITEGQLGELTASTGGIKLIWTNKLNTTAGRANWKRETVQRKEATGKRHHASIELAEKVIDSEYRLLNVVAHEFCHLANFMVSGVTGNPHGREFKSWAARCSAAFGDRGIEVTTRHSYDIAFKYVWECADCALQYKRHSRSIDPERHRCGSCKGLLTQTKPAPRGAAAAADGKKREPTQYQVFVREQMKVLKAENPQSPQKDIMRLVAEKWSSLESKPGTASKKKLAEKSVDDVVDSLDKLSLAAAL
jgi:predicted SprT family Zn-dependent metalloprotease